MSDIQDKNKSKPSFDPTTAKPVNTPLVAKADGFNFDPSTAKEEKKGVSGHLKDTGASLMSGLAGAAEATTVGLADLYTEGRVGRDIDHSGYYKLGEAQKHWSDQKTEIAKEQEKTRQNTDGIWNKTKYVLENPSQITNAVAESLPYMLGGAALGRASKIANPIVAASVGEGAVMAGSQAESIRQQSDDELLNNGQEAVAAGTGVLGGLFGYAGGRLAQKMGLADVDTAMQTGRLTREQIGEATSQVKAKDIPLFMLKGAISEGFLEELPQSVSEQILQNLALDKPWHDGVEDAAVMGTLAGMAMGGTVSGAGKTGDWMNNPRNESPQQNIDEINPQSATAPELGYNGLQGDYIPRTEQNTPNTQQSRTNYTYDQQSTDAENRLNFDNGNDLSGSMDTNDNPTGPDTPPAPNGNYFDIPNTDIAPVDQSPSQQMGIDPNNGPLSTAAALSVDSGASQIITTPTEQSTESTNSMFTDAAIENNLEAQSTAQNEYSDPTALDIQHGMNEIAQGAKEAAVENTIQRLEKDGEVQLFKEDSIAKALENQNYNVRLNDDGSASIIGVKNPATNQWHGQSKEDGSRVSTPLENTVNQQNNDLANQLVTLQQQFEEAKTVPEKAKIRKEINALQQNNTLVQPTETQNKAVLGADGQNQDESGDIRQAKNIDQPSAIENTISASENNISMPKNTILDAQNNIDKTQTNNVADQLAQLEQQFLDAKSVPQKAKLKKQIDQLKSQQTEITTTPFGSEQIQKQYGDTVESVMSDIEILGDDFTIDLRDNNKKTNALNNPNYNTVQKADGSVEIVGMKHPSTGEWVGKKPNAISIDENAHQAATSSQNNTPEPTQAQIEAGNYKKGHIKVHGLDISIENPKGSERRGTDPNGKEWAHTMSDHYGYIKRTKGADNEHIDTYIGNNPDSNQVFIVDQIDQGSGGFDEHKVMLGFDSQEEAITAYKSNFDKGWKVGPIRNMDMEQFKDWLKNEDTSKPATSTDANKPKEAIKDLGEKIGGARKDTALSTGKSKKTKSTDNRPTWAKRYTISEIVSSSNSNETGKWVIEDSKKTDWKGSPKKLGMFDSEQEAKDMLPVVAVGLKHRVYARRDGESGFEIWRQINDVKRVKVVNKVFDTKQDAQTYLIENANNILETSTAFGELDLPRPENTLRKGIERRKGDAKDTDFMKVFGFRGVEFGNWNNQEERQQLLNDAYDGLLDLAEVLKIPAKAISLNGDLALAFGARGQGLSSARAHYEPAKVVINLTKMNGAGSLAHEWWHAFDHYLARQDGIASAEWTVDVDGTRSLKISNSSKDRMVSHGFSYRNLGVREDVRDAYTDLMKTMSTKAEQYVEDVQAVDKFVGQSRDRVKERLDSLREDLSRQRDPKYYKRHNKPASAEQLVVFDTISQKLINGELLETEWRTDVKNKSASGIFSGARWTNDALEQLGEIYKSVRGRSGFSKDQDAVLDRLRSAMNSYANRLKMLADAQKEVSKTRKIPTKFVMDAKNLDEGRGSDYWTTPHELSARAFQGFVEDKITENNGRSPFLNHAPENAVIETPWGWMRPYPHGDERKAINAKFSDLVDTLKTEETETGIKLYSRDKLKPDNERRGASPLDTTFIPLSVVSATRRVLSVLQHLKLSATQDSSSRGRINVSLNNRIGVNKVGNVNSNGFSVQVISSFSDLPKVIQNDATYKDENGKTQNYDVSGVWHDGTLYVVADQVYGDSNKQLTTFDAYEELLTHEIVGHFGVQQIFGREYKTKLQQLFNALGGLEGIRKIAKDNGVDMQQFESAYIEPYTQGAKEGIYAESDVQQALVGELFAFVAQNAKSRPFVRQKLKEVIGYIRQWFRDRGFDKFLSRYNDADLMMFLAEARKAVVDQSYFGKYKDQKIETKQDSNIPQYSRNIKSNSPIAIQSDSEIGQTHFIPSHLMDSVNKLGDVVNDLASMRTEGVKANVPYAIKLLRNIAQLNPNVKIHIVSDLNNIQDKAIRAGLTDGGFYVPDQNTSYIYPKSDAWNSSVLELLNHELVHSVTARSISNGQVSQENLSKLQGVMELLERYIPRNTKTLSEDIKDRLYYAYNDGNFNELLAVGISESNVREALKKALGIEGLKQLDSIFTEISTNQHRGYSNEQKQSRDNQGQQGNGIKKISSPTPREAGKNINSATNVSGSQNAGRDIRDLAQDSGSVNKSSQESSDKFNQNTENDSDKPLYSRQSASNSGSTTQQVRNVLVDRFGKETIDELERQGKLEIIQDYQVEGVEGFYYNGKAVLVASNLTAESTVPTFLHELGGHAGFQNMMNQKQYDELMNQFNKLVEQGNPVAMAAKVLAEREQGSERQQLEYLPYLLTLSSTMQQRNVLQRNALQKLIHNIISHVKAWVFDQFGINLNLNPDDMLALSERMIGQIKHQSSLDLVRQKYQGTSQWMTAPNGATTHLSEQQWLQVRTPEFKKWFGDWENDAANASQVLDENGEPKVVYHGTASEFNEFKQGHGILGDGIYLTDSFDTADVYANIRGENGFVLPLFVNIRNAFQTTANVSRDEIVKATSTGKYQGVIHHFDDQEYIVALEPNQVKMAEGNKGTFNSESSDIRFSRSSNDVADRLSENIKNLYSGNFKLPSMADAMKYGLMFLSRMQITDIYKKILPQLSVYNDLVHQMDADKNDIAAHADNIVREWAKLNKRIDKNDPNSKTEEEALADLMHEATLAQIDPAKPHQSSDDKVKYQQLHKAYNALSPEAQTMYKKARDAYSGHYAKVREAVRERILRSALSSERKADLLKKIEGSFGQIKGVYFPLARFGQYVVVARNQNGDVESISRAETENEAKALRKQLIKKYPQLKVGDVIRGQKYNALRDKVGRGFMSDLFDEVGNLGLDAEKQAEFEDTLGQLYLSSMPDLSWAKHGMHRKGTAGFSNNARRAFAQNMSSGASYLAKLRYGDQLTAQLDEMEEYAKAQIKKDPGYKQPLASAVIDEMNARHENLMNAKGNAVSSLLTSMGFIYFLGLSPAAAMVNIMQTPLVAYPIMGAKFGFDKAGIALLKASSDYAKGVGFEMPDFTDLESFRNSLSDSIDPDIAKVLKEHEKQAYEKAVSAGVIDVTQAHDLAGIAQGEDSGVMWKMRPIMRAASLMFHHAERFNREVTFIAAYRLSKESGMADHDAYKQAVKMTYDGHFDYSASNRARFMQGNVAKVIFLFKQFGQNMIYTIARQTYQSIKGETKEERREARRAISAMLVTHALAAGVLGLPMVTTLLAVASMFGGGDDDPWDAEVALRNGLADMTSPNFSNLVMKGLSRGTSADLSGRVGLDSMFLARAPDGLEGQKLYEQLILGNMGATVGMGANIAKGIQQLGDGNYKRALEEMLPTFAKNPFKAYRYATEGVQDKTGVDIMDGNPVSGAGIFSQTIGFSPSQVRTAYEGKSAIYQQQQALQKRKSELTAKWIRAKRNDDQKGMDSAWKDIQEFNEVNPKLRINRINLMQSYHQNAKRIRDAENGVYLSKKYRDIGDYGRFAETD